MKHWLISPNKTPGKSAVVMLLLLIVATTAFAQTYGDANQDGVINIIDALTVAQRSVGLSVPVFNTVNADVDGNGSITIIDGLLIAQYTVKLITSFPVQSASGSTPVPAFTISNTNPGLNALVTFDASGSSDPDGTIVGYNWDFDDGTTGTGVRVSHSFSKPDDYKVQLTVVDNSNLSKKISKRVFAGRPAGWTQASHSKSADGDYALILPRDKVNRMDIIITPQNYKTIEDDLKTITMFNLKTPIYTYATVKFNGYTWNNVGFRYKGQSTLVSATQGGKHKIPIHLNFDKYEDDFPEIKDQRFYGFKELLLNSNWFDPSFSRDYIATYIFTNGGVHVAQCSYYRIYVDSGSGPVYWGLYTVFEDHGDEMLKTQFDDSDGNLYKPEQTGADLRTYVQSCFKKKTNEDAADYSDVKAFVAALNASRSNAAGWRTNLEATFDVTAFLRWIAINTAIVNVDSYGTTMQNYFLYQDLANGGRLVWIPWDFNLSMDYSMGFMLKPLSLALTEVTNAWPLIRYLMDDSVYKGVYQQEMRNAANGCLKAAGINAELQRLHNMIRPYVVGAEGEIATYSFLTQGATEFDNALTSLTNHVTKRQTEVQTYLNSL